MRQYFIEESPLCQPCGQTGKQETDQNSNNKLIRTSLRTSKEGKMIYAVRNLHEESQGNWLHHWKKHLNINDDEFEQCHVVGCNSRATDGAHVKLDVYSNNWYIVPMCHRHNCQFGDLLLVEGPLVPVNEDNPIKP